MPKELSCPVIFQIYRFLKREELNGDLTPFSLSDPGTVLLQIANRLHNEDYDLNKMMNRIVSNVKMCFQY